MDNDMLHLDHVENALIFSQVPSVLCSQIQSSPYKYYVIKSFKWSLEKVCTAGEADGADIEVQLRDRSTWSQVKKKYLMFFQ